MHAKLSNLSLECGVISFLFAKNSTYTQTKKTVNAENIPGMYVLTNRARDLVTAESEWVSRSRN